LSELKEGRKEIRKWNEEDEDDEEEEEKEPR
jgi:hypothetical protein